MSIAAAKWASQPVYALAKLKVADHLADGERTTAELAARLQIRPEPLRRCLRAAASVGVFQETRPDHWALTETADHLRTDAPVSLRDLVVLLGEPTMWEPFGRIMDVLRDGAPAFDSVHGRSLYDHLAGDPGLSDVYQGAWSPLTRAVMSAVADAYDFSPFTTVADLGGGDGTALRVLLDAYPHLNGILLDLPHALRAQRTPADGTAGRIRTVPGRLPDGVPPGADVYLLKNTLHCLPPDALARTLRRVREAMPRPDQRLLIVEAVIQPGNAFDWSKLMDIEVMITNGGGEHTLDEWEELLRKAGFHLASFHETLPPQWLLEAVPS